MWKRNGFGQVAFLVSLAGLLLGSSVASAEVVERTYKVKGFTWAGCASSLEARLQKVEGVKNVKATFAEAKVEVTFDDEVVTEEEIK